MAKILNEYEQIITKILSEMGVVKTEQLVIALMKSLNVNLDSALQFMKDAQKNRRVLMSIDGYSMSVGTYHSYIDDPFMDRCKLNDEDCVIAFDIGKEIPIDEKLINSFWITVSMYPNSKDFYVGRTPWFNTFIYEKKIPETNDIESYACQVTYIPKDQERAYAVMLLEQPKIYFKEFRNAIKRFAIIEEESRAWMVPKIGFEYICVLDEDSPTKYRIIEERDIEERWADCESEGH